MSTSGPELCSQPASSSPRADPRWGGDRWAITLPQFARAASPHVHALPSLASMRLRPALALSSSIALAVGALPVWTRAAQAAGPLTAEITGGAIVVEGSAKGDKILSTSRARRLSRSPSLTR